MIAKPIQEFPKSFQAPYVLLLVLLFASCQEAAHTGPIDVEELPSIQPKQLWSMESVDTLFFAHLGYESVPLEDGSFLAYDRQYQVLMHLGPDGALRNRLTRPGRGPAEVGDILNLVKTPSGGALLYDQENRKAVRFDGNLEYQTEFTVPSSEGRTPTGVWPGEMDSMYVVEMRSSMRQMLENPMDDVRIYLGRYNEERESYGEIQGMLGYTFAPHLVNGTFAGGMRVPNAPATLMVFKPETGTFYQHLSGSGEIAEISVDFDTLRTMPLNLPREEMSRAERDSLIKENERIGREVLLEKLPEQKVPVEKVLAGPGGEIWLKLNYAGETTRWLVMSREGEPLYVVHLPGGSMLLHVSDHNLAVRLDDITLALYEGPGLYREQL